VTTLKYVAEFQPPLCGKFWIPIRDYDPSDSVIFEYVNKKELRSINSVADFLGWKEMNHFRCSVNDCKKLSRKRLH